MSPIVALFFVAAGAAVPEPPASVGPASSGTEVASVFVAAEPDFHLRRQELGLVGSAPLVGLESPSQSCRPDRAAEERIAARTADTR